MATPRSAWSDQAKPVKPVDTSSDQVEVLGHDGQTHPPTTVAQKTGRSLKPRFCSLQNFIGILLLPLLLVCAVIGFVWFLISIIYGLLTAPCQPSWLKNFWRDIWGAPMTEEEEKASVASVLEALRGQLAGSKKPPANPERPHGKTHAILKGKFKIGALPKELAVGIFAKPAEFDAIVRSSEGISTTSDSATGGPQGFAVKLCNVPQDSDTGPYMMFTGDEPQWEQEEKMKPNSYDGGQEVDLITASPVVEFLVKNIREMYWFGLLQNPNGGIISMIRQIFYLPTFRPIAHVMYMLWVAYWQQLGKGPLGWPYHSVVPSKFGDRVVKFYFLPDQEHRWKPCCCFCSSVCICACICNCCAGKNALTEAFSSYLNNSTATFGYYVQFQPSPDAKNYDQYPIEDAYKLWNQDDQPLHRIATLTLPPQNIDTPERWERGQTLWYNPFNTFKAHEPLSNLNRARHHLYYSSGVFRVLRLGGSAPPRCPFF